MEKVVEVLIYVVIALGPIIFGIKVLSGKQKLEFKSMQPILLATLKEVEQYLAIKGTSYAKFEKFAVELIYRRLQDTKLLTEEELVFFNKEVIGQLIRRELKSIYKKK